MTEKRLIVDEDYNIVDTLTGEGLDDTQVFDLVNELHEENKQLKKEILWWKHRCGEDISGDVKMNEKQFRVQEHCLRSSYGIEAENWLVTNDNHSVVLNDKAEAHMVANMFNDVIDVLNALHEENEQLKRQIGNLEHTKDFCADVCADCERLEKENEQLKQSNQKLNDELQETMGYLALKSGVEKENEQLKKQIERIDFILDDLNGAEYISRDDGIKALNKIDKVIGKR